MPTHRIYLMKLYEVTINDIKEEIIVQHMEGDEIYLCRFSKNENLGFYNIYDCFGFYVDKSNEPIKYELNGKLNEEDAKNIWTQVELSFNNPIDTAFLRGRF